MIPGFLLGLREGLEAALILGTALAVVQRSPMRRLGRYLWLGAAAATAVSLVVAWGLARTGTELTGIAEQVFEGSAMLLAAAVLTWMLVWMQGHGREAALGLTADVTQAASAGQRGALFSLAFLAILREGVELALFLTAIMFTSGITDTVIGGLAGVLAAAALGWGIFAAGLRLALPRFFAITQAILLLVAAGLVGHGVHEFNEIGWIPPLLSPIWDLNHVLPDSSTLGQVLRAMFGYNADPSLTEAIAYAAYMIGIVALLRRGRSPRRGAAP